MRSTAPRPQPRTPTAAVAMRRLAMHTPTPRRQRRRAVAIAPRASATATARRRRRRTRTLRSLPPPTSRLLRPRRHRPRLLVPTAHRWHRVGMATPRPRRRLPPRPTPTRRHRLPLLPQPLLSRQRRRPTRLHRRRLLRRHTSTSRPPSRRTRRCRRGMGSPSRMRHRLPPGRQRRHPRRPSLATTPRVSSPQFRVWWPGAAPTSSRARTSGGCKTRRRDWWFSSKSLEMGLSRWAPLRSCKNSAKLSARGMRRRQRRCTCISPRSTGPTTASGSWA
mmetsp:Transcript_1682/g.5486  ORF Transcript_1682/g.5486 Transcript_1682/m.5486 type:complete len:277 (-) Transcript_1682:442-1272(-)